LKNEEYIERISIIEYEIFNTYLFPFIFGSTIAASIFLAIITFKYHMNFSKEWIVIVVIFLNGILMYIFKLKNKINYLLISYYISILFGIIYNEFLVFHANEIELISELI
jgi:hypothetical protein